MMYVLYTKYISWYVCMDASVADIVSFCRTYRMQCGKLFFILEHSGGMVHHEGLHVCQTDNGLCGMDAHCTEAHRGAPLLSHRSTQLLPAASGLLL